MSPSSPAPRARPVRTGNGRPDNGRPDNPRPKTRERILVACRELFNARGPDGVTTAEIARAVAINEGNLYYHFNRKEDLLEALFERFSAELLRVSRARAAAAPGEERYALYIDGWFRIMWKWRFFYRDGGAVFRLAPALPERLRAVSQEGLAQTRATVVEMGEAGLMRIPPEMVDRVVVNAWIVATYWLDHLRSRHGVEAPTREDVEEGRRQVLSLFVPFLTEKGRALGDPRGSASATPDTLDGDPAAASARKPEPVFEKPDARLQ